ncbi:unnamed protein product [Microthlaspi erraticum]|uniref:FAR1 domain-containing protein n=1 Tax=Microthlaspi erraticum TaxID=1685480 RepID=A0A6D2IIJ4_9BRAS|nr:unnamed protein product [Microthlaspi erraticum]
MTMESNKGDDSRSPKPRESETVEEPCLGMEFESEDEARDFYVDYARKSGFVVRMMQRRRTGIDGRTLARRLGCNKQGFSPNISDFGTEKQRSRSSAREGCKATILVKMEKSGKWVVTRFVKEHNHSLVLSSSPCDSLADKDEKIKELTEEVELQGRLCDLYRDKLVSFMNNVEQYNEELSIKVHEIVENIKKLECEMQMHKSF